MEMPFGSLLLLSTALSLLKQSCSSRLSLTGALTCLSDKISWVWETIEIKVEDLFYFIFVQAKYRDARDHGN
jgi:hypothetical protein